MDPVLVILLIAQLDHVFSAPNTFSFSSYYANHMVLQKGQQGASIWGYSPKHGDTVYLYLNNQLADTVTVDNHGIWQGVVKHGAINQGSMVTASSSLGNLTLRDVLFGDVWLCSGQSNMAFPVHSLKNATDEEGDVSGYHNIRLLKATQHFSTSPLDEFFSIARTDHWSIPTAVSVRSFSAVCWLFGKYLSSHVTYPIGLVESDWGGTPIEAWSSVDALHSCNSTQRHNSPSPATQRSDTTLWNGQIVPLIRTTIYGALWYQGEANSRNALDYSCRFPAMIADWRSQFHLNSKQTTDAMFPFGFVQLAPNRNTSDVGSFPQVRWAQTANLGHVPNTRLKNVFMAVALDLPDFTSNHGTVAYNKTGINFQGPYPSSYKLNSAAKSLAIEFDHGASPIDVRNNDGFEICCSLHRRCHAYINDHGWMKAPIKSHDTSSVTLDISGCSLAQHIVGGVRYEWSESPCDFKNCAIYGADTYLPSPPFITTHIIH